MSAVAAEFPFDGREFPQGVQEQLSPWRNFVHAIASGTSKAAGWTWRVIKAAPFAAAAAIGFAFYTGKAVVVGVWRLSTPLVRGIIITSLAAAALFGANVGLQAAMWGMLGLGAFTVVGEVASLVSRKRQARRDRKLGERLKVGLVDHIQETPLEDLLGDDAVAPLREQAYQRMKPAQVWNQATDTLTMFSVEEEVPEGTEVVMAWSEAQYRAANDRKHYLETELSKAQEDDDKARRSEFAGRLHMLLRRWHLDTRSPRTLRDELKANQVEFWGESECGRRYNWNLVLTSMKDEDDRFTPMMADG